MKFSIAAACAVLCAVSCAAYAQITPSEYARQGELPEYTVARTADGIVIDGVLDDPDWDAAESVGTFRFPWYVEGERAQTEVKLLWDDEFLYIAYRCDDAYIWADHYSTNEDTYQDDAVEFFWNPSPAQQTGYYMFEINCLGNLLSVVNVDHFVTSIHQRPSRIIPPHIAQHIHGTLNDDSDTDEGWVLELAIRFADYTRLSAGRTPVAGDMWRVALNRCGGRTNIQDSQWSPARTEKKNFHSWPDFGRIVFSDKPVHSQ